MLRANDRQTMVRQDGRNQTARRTLARVVGVLGALFVLAVAFEGTIHAAASGQGGTGSTTGVVMARAIVLGPNGRPIYAEFNENGGVDRVIGEAFGLYRDSQVMSGTSYKAFLALATAFREENEDGVAAGSVFMTAAQFGARSFETTGGDPIAKPAIDDAVKSVLVRGEDLLTSQQTALVLLTSPIDMTQPTTLETDTKSLILDLFGRVVFESAVNIGFRTAFLQPADASDPNDTSNDERTRRRADDKVLGPVRGARVEPTIDLGGANIVQQDGSYRLDYKVPACPGFQFLYEFPTYVHVPYRSFNPKGKKILNYTRSLPDFYSCSNLGATAESFSLAGLSAQAQTQAIEAGLSGNAANLDFTIDVIILSGEAVLIGPDGQKPVPIELETQYSGKGLLKQISLADMEDTDLYVFRESNGQLVTVRKGLRSEEVVPFNSAGVDAERANFFYRMLMRGPRAGADFGITVTGGFEQYQAAAQMNPALQRRNADHLRPGEEIRLIAINRPSGYMASTLIKAGSPDQTGEGSTGAGTFNTQVPKLLLRPPNLKIEAERTYVVEAGLSADERFNEREARIGSEGTGLTSDRVISITTEWLDHDDKPLPAELEGYTGRLSKVVSQNVLKAAGNDVANFEIKPGRHVQVVRLSDTVTGREHLYVQVNGQPTDRNPQFDTLASSNTDDALKVRPKHFVPVRVPFFDEAATRAQEEAAARALAAAYSGTGPPPVLEKPQPIYNWQYRPEFQFSLFDLAVHAIEITSDPAGVGSKLEVDYDLNGPVTSDALLPPLPRLNGDRQFKWDLGVLQTLAEITENPIFDTLASFNSIEQALASTPATQLASVREIFDSLQPEDFLTLQLFQTGDAANGLYEYAGLPLIISTRLADEAKHRIGPPTPISLRRITHVASYDPGTAGNAGEDEVTDTFQMVPFFLTQPADVDIRILDANRNPVRNFVSQNNLPPGDWSFVLVTTDIMEGAGLRATPNTYDFFVEIVAVATDDTTPLTHTLVHPGKLEEIRSSKMLGNVLQHETLIQNGGLSLRRHDLSVKGRGPDLTFIRSYSNQARVTAAAPLGEGWSHNHSITLRVDAYGRSVVGRNVPAWVDRQRGELFRPSQIDLVAEEQLPRLVTISNGGQFKWNGSGWSSQRSYHGTLVQVGNVFEYRSKDGTLYNFVAPQATSPQLASTVPTRVSLGDSLYSRIGLDSSALVIGGGSGNAAVFLNPNLVYGGSPTQSVRFIEDRNGNRMTYEYIKTQQGELVSLVTDAVGRTLEFEYDNILDPRLTRVTGPDGIVLDFGYTDVGLGLTLMTRFSRDEFSEDYVYTGETFSRGHNLTTLTDANGRVTSYGYKPILEVTPQILAFLQLGNVEDIIGSVTYAAGTPAEAVALFDYVTDGTNNRIVTDPRGNATEYRLNTFGNPIVINEPLGKTTEMTWSIDANPPQADNVMLTQDLTHLGLEQTYTYDIKGNITSEFDNETGATMTQSWNLQYSLLEDKTDKNGERVLYAYDANGNLDTETIFRVDVGGLFADVSQTHTYDPTNGDRLTTTDFRSNTTTFTYDAQGNLATILEPEGSLTQYVNDVRGRVIQETDPNGNVRLYEYDTLDRLVLETDPRGNTHEIVYDPKGNKLQETRLEDYSVGIDATTTTLTLDYVYDGRDRVTRVDRGGSGPGAIIAGTQSTEYDDNSNVTRETRWLNGLPILHQYDELNRKTLTTDRGGDAMSYDYTFVVNEGTEVVETDEEGRPTTKLFDRLERIETVDRPPVVPLDTDGTLLPAESYTRSYVYDNTDHVLFATDEEGRTTDFVYDGRYTVIAKTNPLLPVRGTFVTQCDENGNPVREIDEEGRATEYVYDRQNRRTEVRQPEGHTTTYDYDANSSVVETVDPWGFAYSSTYDSLDHPITQTDPDGTTVANHTAAGKLTFSRNAEDQEMSYLYDALGRIVEETDPRGRKTFRAWDENNNALQVLRTWPGQSSGGPPSVRDVRTYDAKDRLESETLASQAQNDETVNVTKFILYTYDRVDNLTLAEHPNGRRVATQYDEFDRPIRMTDALLQTTIQRYDGVGNLRFVSNRRGHTTEYQHDRLDRKIKDILPTLSGTGVTITKDYDYDAVGNLVLESNPRRPGIAEADTIHVYDDLDRLVSSNKRAIIITDPPIRLIFNEYDTNGLGLGVHQNATTDAVGNRVVSDFNFRQQPIRRVYPLGETETMVYDLIGNELSMTDEEGFVTSYTYFDDNTVATQTNAESEMTRFDYDINGNRIREQRPNGPTHTKNYRFDERSRLARITQPEGDVTRFEYDRNDNLRHQYTAPANDAGVEGHVEYQYDLLNRRTFHIQHKATGNLITAMHYDPEANEVRRVDAKGQEFLYTYDEIHRQVLATYPTAGPTPYLTIESIAHVYDNNNNPVLTTETKQGSADGSGLPGTTVDVCDKEYDLLDRLVEKIQRGHTISYSYDDNGNRLSVASPDGATAYTYDHRNRLATAILDGGLPTTYTYLDNNWQSRIDYTNGTAVETIYDQVKRPLQVINRAPDASRISEFTYSYDDNGNRLTQVEFQGGFPIAQDETTSYAYDLNDRMTRVEVTTVDSGDVLRRDYTYYDSWDRRDETETLIVSGVPGAPNVQSYSYDETHWVQQVVDSSTGQSIDYAYDNNGNTLTRTDETVPGTEETQFVYDSRNQLVQTTRGPPAGQAIQGRYDYDYAGLRVRHLDSERGDVESFSDGAAILDEHQVGTGALISHYNYADRLLSLKAPASTQYYHFAALDTTANLSDETGAVQASYRTDVWGEVTEDAGASPNRQVFTGQEWDENTGLVYFGARYYDPATARFITQDSHLGSPDTAPSLHRYLYAYSNPTVYVDLYGYSSEDSSEESYKFSDGSNTTLGDDWNRVRHDSEGRIDWNASRQPPQRKNSVVPSAAEPTAVANTVTVEEHSGPQSGADLTSKRERDLEYAKLSQCVYGGDACGIATTGWKAVSDDQLNKLGLERSQLTNDKTGFKSNVYYHEGRDRYVLALAGTEDLGPDLVADLRQGIGRPDPQYEQAIELAQILSAGLSGTEDANKLVLTGHSLGGGLAAAAGMVTSSRFVTFNAAGVHADTVGRYGADFKRASQLGVNYRVSGEALTGLQEGPSGLIDSLRHPIRDLLAGVAPDAIGTQITTYTPGNGRVANPAAGTKHERIGEAVLDGLDYPIVQSGLKHTMAEVLRAMKNTEKRPTTRAN